MYCVKCKKEIPDNSSFCRFCGAKQPVSRIKGTLPVYIQSDSSDTSSEAVYDTSYDTPPETSYGAPYDEDSGTPYSAPCNTTSGTPYSAPYNTTSDTLHDTRCSMPSHTTNGIPDNVQQDRMPAYDSTPTSKSGSMPQSSSAPTFTLNQIPPAAPSVPVKKSKMPLIVGCVVGAAAVIGISAFLYVKLSKTTINLDDYVTVKCSGVTGYGTAYASLDYGALEAEYGDDDNFDDLYNCITVYIDKTDDLANDDIVNVIWDCDDDTAKELGYILKYTDMQKTISGLDLYQEIYLNNYLHFSCGGFNGQGVAEIWLDKYRIAQDYAEYDNIQELCSSCCDVSINYDLTNNENLSTGDPVHPEWHCDDDYANYLGFELTYNDTSFAVSELPDYESTSSTGSITLEVDHTFIQAVQGEQCSFTFTVGGSLPKRYTIYYDAPPLLSCEWGDWEKVDGGKKNRIPLYATASDTGNYVIDIKLYNTETEEVYKTMQVCLYVSPAVE